MKRPSLRIARRKDGGGIELRVTHARKMRRYGLGADMRAAEGQWSEAGQRFTAKMPGHAGLNATLGHVLAETAGILDRLLLGEDGFTWEAFDRLYRNAGQAVDVLAYTHGIAEAMKASDRIGTARAYRTLLARLRHHTGGKPLPFAAITEAWLKKWEHALRRGGANNGGIATYLRYLKAVINAAIKDGLMDSAQYPFATPRAHGYELKKLRGTKAPRPLSDVDLAKLKALPLKKHPELVESLLLFLFMYHGRGIGFADIARLPKQPTTGMMAYSRQKNLNRTNRVITLTITGERARILAHFARLPGPFAFPILTERHRTEAQKHNRIDARRKKMNKDLKRIAELAGIDVNLVTYTARHSFASVMHRRGVDVKRISEALGHASLEMSQSYIQSLGDEALDDTDDLL